MSSPELQFDPFDLPPTGSDSTPTPEASAALKKQVADRLAAHRSRRNRRADSNLIAIPNVAPHDVEIDRHPSLDRASCPVVKPAAKSAPRPAKSRANRIAAAVAERYANSTSYREFLAAEAGRAIAEANATAEIAARTAEAVTAVQQQLLAELDLWDEPDTPEPATPEPEVDVPATTRVPHSSQSYRDEWDSAASVPHSSQPHRDEWAATTPPVTAPQAVVQQPLASGLTVRLYEDVGLRQPEPRTTTRTADQHDHDALNQLDDEIAFRQAPVFDEPATPPVPIPANLIQFPRQLVAARKSRPRIAEGPLRDEADTAPASAQLRIFEVDAAQFSTAPVAEPETSLPEWSSIHLDATPVILPEPSAAAGSVQSASSEALLQTQLYVPIDVAPIGDRVMAAAVDACLLGVAFLGAVSAFAYSVKSLPALPVAAIASAATLLVLFVLYHMLFFTFACATPGMRYARIGLCTFSDDNPTRAEMRRRVWFILLAACPLGLGLLWSLLDEDSLGWHDRLSRIYQRSY
jgi:hypothetical protein